MLDACRLAGLSALEAHYADVDALRKCSPPPLMRRFAATLPSSVGVEQKRAPNGHYFIWLDPRY